MTETELSEFNVFLKVHQQYRWFTCNCVCMQFWNVHQNFIEIFLVFKIVN